MPITGPAPLNLQKPEASELVSLTVINGNYDLINDYAVSNNSRITAAEARITTAESDIDAIQAAIPSIYTPVVTTISATTHALASSNSLDTLRFTSGSNVTITVNDALQNAEYVNCTQDGAGKLIFVAGSGVTLQSPQGNNVRSSVQYGWVSIIKIATGTYRLIGNLESNA
jgi:hypothetical protein